MATSLALAIPLVIMASAFWASYPQRALAQNTPLNAQLVPGFRRRLLNVTVALWLATATLIAAVFALSFGHFIQIWLIAAAIALYIALCLRSPWIFTLYLLAWLASNTGLTPWPLLEAALRSALGGAGLLVAMIVLGYVAWSWIFARGGDGHWRLQGRQARMTRAFRGGPQPQATKANRWLGGVNPLSYHRFLQTALVQGHKPVELLSYGLGPNAFWGTFYSQVLITAVLILGALLARHLGLLQMLGINLPDAMLRAMLLPGLIPLLTAPWTLWSAIYQSRKEQALLQLLPGVPQGRALNRVLACLHLRYLLRAWLLFGLLGGLLMLLPGAKDDWVTPVLGALAAFNLLTAGLVLGDYARLKPPSLAGYAWLMVAAFVFVGAWIFVDRVLFAVPLPLLCTLCALVAAVWMYLRWRMMLAAPNAFPAGRMAAS
ncbi:MAG TPA: hypothetical protein VIM95_13505 [Chitinimonas sp.]